MEELREKSYGDLCADSLVDFIVVPLTIMMIVQVFGTVSAVRDRFKLEKERLNSKRTCWMFVTEGSIMWILRLS